MAGRRRAPRDPPFRLFAVRAEPEDHDRPESRRQRLDQPGCQRWRDAHGAADRQGEMDRLRQRLPVLDHPRPEGLRRPRQGHAAAQPAAAAGDRPGATHRLAARQPGRAGRVGRRLHPRRIQPVPERPAEAVRPRRVRSARRQHQQPGPLHRQPRPGRRHRPFARRRQAELDALVDQAHQYADQCAKRNAEVLPYLSTAAVVDDLESIRAAVGDEKLSYLGFSYGTLIGSMYADKYPDKIRAMVLDGAVDPALNEVQLRTGQAKAFEAALRRMLDEVLQVQVVPVLRGRQVPGRVRFADGEDREEATADPAHRRTRARSGPGSPTRPSWARSTTRASHRSLQLALARGEGGRRPAPRPALGPVPGSEAERLVLEPERRLLLEHVPGLPGVDRGRRLHGPSPPPSGSGAPFPGLGLQRPALRVLVRAGRATRRRPRPGPAPRRSS